MGCSHHARWCVGFVSSAVPEDNTVVFAVVAAVAPRWSSSASYRPVPTLAPLIRISGRESRRVFDSSPRFSRIEVKEKQAVNEDHKDRDTDSGSEKCQEKLSAVEVKVVIDQDLSSTHSRSDMSFQR
ncbi:hypothetical protein B296_00059218 [Ensete ventricosum]|uniref:Uncharacterized protein n=1 Tax=Ensete ventricosum TaxID=4639 RepID=A0A426XIP0_ENSVE|nr:hypothetical protein B296_00059218 [Ensete ventricosum]